MRGEPGGWERYREALRRWGTEAVGFEGLKPGLRLWEGAEGCVAYAEVWGAWVGVGRPLGADPEGAAEAFRAAGRRAGRRVLCFGAESTPRGWRSLVVGEEPWFSAGGWRRGRGRVQAQVRRAWRKGVRVRVVGADELEVGGALREAVERLGAEWLGAHHAAPLGFIVGVAPFGHAEAHRYVVAERGEELVGFLSAIPIGGVEGWFVEDLWRREGAPNGTNEALLDGFFRDLGDEVPVTLGLAPLAGVVPRWLRWLKVVTRPLYDFNGLEAFKRRLRPERWQEVVVAYPPETRGRVVVATVRAFAGGSLVRFGWQTLVRHPSGPPFALFVPLVPWTMLLAGVAVAGQAGALGFGTAALWGWVGFDAVLAGVLYQAARRPKARWLGLGLGLAVGDAVLSVGHLGAVGWGADWLEVGLRGVATLAPVLGALGLGLAWRAAWRRWRRGSARKG